MTDRIFAYTVTLEREIREDDAEHITNAIRMIKGVTSAVPIVASVESHWALEAARRELRDELWRVLYPKLA
jgi:hypothetical protein